MRKDVMTPSQRHLAMAHNRGRTFPEKALASAMWRQGLRYLTPEGYKSVKGQRLSGNPDIVFPQKKIVIFVDGCFWHGCPECCKHSGLSTQFWVSKISANKERDLRVTKELSDIGWTVFRIPEHDVRTQAALSETVGRLVPLIHAASSVGAALEVGDNNV